MANEISASVSMGVSVSGQSAQGSGSFQLSYGGTGFIGNEQIIGTSDESINFGDVGTPKALFIKNLDPDNFVQIDSASTYDKFPQKLYPGQCTILFPETGTIHMKADTASVKVFIVAG